RGMRLGTASPSSSLRSPYGSPRGAPSFVKVVRNSTLWRLRRFHGHGGSVLTAPAPSARPGELLLGLHPQDQAVHAPDPDLGAGRDGPVQGPPPPQGAL